MKKDYIVKRLGVIALTTAVSFNSIGVGVGVAAASPVLNSNGPRATSPSIPVSKLSIAHKELSIAELNQLSYKDLITYLSTFDQYRFGSNNDLRVRVFDAMKKFYGRNEDVYAFNSDLARRQALIDAMIEKAPHYTANDTKGIATIAEVLRRGHFIAFEKKEEVPALNLYEEEIKVLPALEAVTENPNFTLGTEVQGRLLNNIAGLSEATTNSPKVLNSFAPILEELVADTELYYKGKGKYLDQRWISFYLCSGAQKAINRYVKNYNKLHKNEAKMDPSKSPWSGKIDPFIEAVSKFSLLRPNEYIDNGIFFDSFSVGPARDNLYLYNNLHTNPESINAIIKLNEDFKDSLPEKYYPNTYVFDNGQLVIKTGDKVTKESVLRMYWSTKEVSAQFHRNYLVDEPVDPETPKDKTLTSIIYNNPTEYKNNEFINGIATNNGGIYIEGGTTLYSYDRTKQQSIYTLEELFRHEYTHYLQARYIIPGLYGGPIYANGRLVWFNEGGAEFFVGSTRTDDVKRRHSITALNTSFHREPWKRYSFSQVLDFSGYTGGLYTYSYAYKSFLYEKYPHLFRKAAELIRAYDIEGYNAYTKMHSNDERLKREFIQYMHDLYRYRNSYRDGAVDPIYLTTHPTINPEEVYAEIKGVAGLEDMKVDELRGDLFNTFSLSGTYTGFKSQGEEKDLQRMKGIANGFLKTLSANSWSGYDTINCYYTNYRVDADNNVVFKMTFTGPLTKELENKTPTAAIDASPTAVTDNIITFNGDNSLDPDGIITNYEWDFGDGKTSTKENPDHTYNTNGHYRVTLTVTDFDGAKSTTTKDITVTNYLINESENNNHDKRADGPIYENRVVSGSLKKGDYKDCFYFDVVRPGKVTVTLDPSLTQNANLTLRNELNHHSKVITAKRTENNLIISELLEPGRYYVNLINKDKMTDNPYTLHVEGPIQGSEEKTIVGFEKIDDVRLNPNEAHLLPEGINAIMDNGDIELVPVTWTNSFDASIPGEYNIVGTVAGTELTVSQRVTVMDHIFKEIEWNGNRDKATGPLTHDKEVIATLDKNDITDYFSINVLRPGAVTFSVVSDNIDDLKLTLLDEAGKRMTFDVLDISDSEKQITQLLKAGRHYMSVRSKTKGDSSYKIKVRGPINGSMQQTITALEQFEDIQLNLNEDYQLPDTIKITLKDGSIQDTFVQWNKELDTSQPGIYELTGSVHGTDLVTTFKATVMSYIFREVEPNDDPSKATGLLSDNKLVTGSISSKDTRDYFSFEVLRAGKVTLTVDSAKSEDIAIHIMDKDNKRIKDITPEQDGALTHYSFYASPGHYYSRLRLEKGELVPYTLNLTGPITGSQKTTIQSIRPHKDLTVSYKDALKLPVAVDAVLDNDTVEKVPVIWNSELDTSHPGIYSVTGTIPGTDIETTIKVIILDHIINEVEQNSDFDSASGPIFENVGVTGTVNNTDTADYYYFNVIEAGVVTVNINCDNIKNGYFLLADENREFMRNINKVESDDSLELSFTASPGKYYLLATLKDLATTKFDITVNGPIQVRSITSPTINDGAENNLPLTVNDLPNADSEADSTTTDVIEISNPTSSDITEITETNVAVPTDIPSLFNNATVRRTLDSTNAKDVFYFDVLEDGQVAISVDGILDEATASKMNWVLRKDSMTGSYTTWAKRTGNTLANTFEATPGRYFLDVYKSGNITSDYALTVDGPIVEKQKAKKTNNNRHDTATKITFPKLNHRATLIDSDKKDIYYFDIMEDKEISIIVTPEDGVLENMHWVIRRADNLDKYFSWAKKADGKLSKTFTAPAGRYYLEVYKQDKTDISYSLEVQ